MLPLFHRGPQVNTVRSNQVHTMTLHIYIPQRMSHQVSTCYALHFQGTAQKRSLKVKVTVTRSNQDHTVTHLGPHPMVLSSIRFLQLIVSKKWTRSQRPKIKSKSHHDMELLHPHPCKISTSYILQFPRYSLDKILKVKITISGSKVKSRSHHDVAYTYTIQFCY